MAESIFKTKHDKVEGIWIRGDYEQNASAFSKETHDSLYAIEDSSWWFQYRMSLISLLVNKYYSKDITIVDVGGGNGYTTKKLIEEGFACLLIEPSIEGCLNAVKRGIPEIFCDAIIKENIVPKSIRQIVILDVLEHLESDEDMIQTLAYALQDQGKIVITVPAFSCLWSSEDDAAGHFRRYRIKQLKSLLERNGFSMDYSSYFFSFLWLPILFVRKWCEKIGFLKRVEKRTELEQEKIVKQQFGKPNKFLYTFLKLFEKMELGLIKRKQKVRFGTSIIVVAHKKKS